MSLSLCSALVRQHLEESCVHFFAPQYKRGKDMLETAQRKATKMMKVLERVFYQKQLTEGSVQPGEDKAQGRSYQCWEIPEGRIQR